MENLLIPIWNCINTILTDIFCVYCWKKLLNKNLKREKIKTLFIAISLAILTTTFNFLLPQPLRMIIVFILLIFICYMFVTKNLNQAILLVMISQIIIWISEFSFAIIISIFYHGDIQSLVEKPWTFFLLNIYITVVSFLITKTSFPSKLFHLLNVPMNSKFKNESFIYSIIIILIIIISTTESYMKLPIIVVLITNLVMAITFISIIIMSSKVKESYNKISSKYETSISSLKEYEVMIDKFRIVTHENKNEFLTIRNMIKNADDKNTVIKYIDKLVDNKIKDNDKIMKKTAKIPSGGLRATIYSKLCLMDTLKIKSQLNISRDVRTTDLIDLDEDLTLKICKILGVFLDNAIEAVKKLSKKEISVEIYSLDNNLCVDVTNNFKGNLDLEKISDVKYTTKGDGHGYGLTLVNQILKEEPDKLENEKSVNRDTFTQTLKIKM